MPPDGTCYLSALASAEYAGLPLQSERVTPKAHFSSVGGTAIWKLRVHTIIPPT